MVEELGQGAFAVSCVLSNRIGLLAFSEDGSFLFSGVLGRSFGAERDANFYVLQDHFSPLGG